MPKTCNQLDLFQLHLLCGCQPDPLHRFYPPLVQSCPRGYLKKDARSPAACLRALLIFAFWLPFYPLRPVLFYSENINRWANIHHLCINVHLNELARSFDQITLHEIKFFSLKAFFELVSAYEDISYAVRAINTRTVMTLDVYRHVIIGRRADDKTPVVKHKHSLLNPKEVYSKGSNLNNIPLENTRLISFEPRKSFFEWTFNQPFKSGDFVCEQSFLLARFLQERQNIVPSRRVLAHTINHNICITEPPDFAHRLRVRGTVKLHRPTIGRDNNFIRRSCDKDRRAMRKIMD